MFVLHEIYGPLLKKKILKILIIPGLAAFLVFKILACYLVGAKVQDTKLLDDDREILTYGEPKIGMAGHFVISVVPFFCMLLLFCILNILLDMPVRLHPDSLPEIALLWNKTGAFFSQFMDFILWFFSGLFKHGFKIPAFWIILSLGVNLILALAPTLKEFKYIALAAGILLGIGILLEVLGMGLTQRTDANLAILKYLGHLKMNVSFLLGLAFIWLAASVITVGAYRLYTKAGEGKGKDRK
jgi:hypothetical protein